MDERVLVVAVVSVLRVAVRHLAGRDPGVEGSVAVAVIVRVEQRARMTDVTIVIVAVIRVVDVAIRPIRQAQRSAVRVAVAVTVTVVVVPGVRAVFARICRIPAAVAGVHDLEPGVFHGALVDDGAVGVLPVVGTGQLSVDVARVYVRIAVVAIRTGLALRVRTVHGNLQVAIDVTDREAVRFLEAARQGQHEREAH